MFPQIFQSPTNLEIENGKYIGVYSQTRICKNILSNVIGTELASIHSLQDNTVARGAMNNNRGWFGFNDFTTDGTYVWTDGTPSDHYNWYPNEPNVVQVKIVVIYLHLVHGMIFFVIIFYIGLFVIIQVKYILYILYILCLYVTQNNK